MTAVQPSGGYICADADRRRQDTVTQGRLNGIDDVEVDGGHPGIPPRRTLLVRCLRPLPAVIEVGKVQVLPGRMPPNQPVAVSWALAAPELAQAHAARPGDVTAEDVAQFGGDQAPPDLLVVRTASVGDLSPYLLRLEIPGFDPRLAEACFSFAIDCPGDVDCLTPQHCPPERSVEPAIDYLNRDFLGLRQLLLDRLSVVTPAWTDRSPADLGVMLVELFAYLGDYLAAAQDAVSAEAYLGTARLRISLARHARLLDYQMHQGAAARVWLVLEVDADTSAGYLRRARCLPASDGGEALIPAGHQVRSPDGVVFHTLHPVSPRFSRNEIDIYTWSGQECCLPTGATQATLVGTTSDLGLAAGNVLILEEVRGVEEGAPADVSHRWPVRLCAVPKDAVDPLTGIQVVEVRWYEQDALPFPLCVKRFPGRRCLPDEGVAVARGNVVLAEHGARTAGAVIPARVPVSGTYRPALPLPGVAFAVPYMHENAVGMAAAAAVRIDPRQAQADVVRLTDGRDDWTLRRDLLGSDRFAPDYVVEMAEQGWAYLRFGDDVSGRQPTPGREFQADYRIGGGRSGNVGREVLTELDPPLAGIAVRNPMPATGGEDPEAVEQVRQFAPQAFRVQQRAVTEQDYATLAARDPSVQRAVATRRWTGSWYTEYVTVDRRGGAAVDLDFRTAFAAWLDRYRMAGGDVEVTAPVFVPIDIVLGICVKPGYFRGTVHQALDDRFSTRELPGGERGFFHPDNFTFAQPVYLSAVVAAAMSIAGVASVTPRRFQRLGQDPAGELAAGRIPMAGLVVAQCDSDPADPASGQIQFDLAGGL